jgi:putative transposase
VTPDVKRDAVAHVCEKHGVSQRQACEVLSIDRSSVRSAAFGPMTLISARL